MFQMYCPLTAVLVRTVLPCTNMTEKQSKVMCGQKNQLCGMSEKNAVKREIKMRVAISVGEDEEFQLTIGKGRLLSLEE